MCWHAFRWPLLGAPPCRQPSASPASQVTPASRESRLPGSTLIVCLAASEAHPRLDYHKNTETFLQSTPLPNLLLHFFSPVLLLPLSLPSSIYHSLLAAALPTSQSRSATSTVLSQPADAFSLTSTARLWFVSAAYRMSEHPSRDTHNTLMEIGKNEVIGK